MRYVFVVAFLAVGWLVPRILVDDGVGQFAGDPNAAGFAREALVSAWQSRDNPVARVLTPVARVVEVQRAPGHCVRGEPGSTELFAEYYAEVRFHTFFAIPAGTVYVTCGGWSWSRQRPFSQAR